MPGGRPQREPMERLVRLVSVLSHAGSAGVSASKLITTAGFQGEGDPASQLTKEFRELRKLGWEITNIAPDGEDGHYRMTGVDNRLRVKLTPEQQAALRRAVLVADRDDLVAQLGLAASAKPEEVPALLDATAPAPGLSTVVDAVRRARLLRFDYKGKTRVVHPQSLRIQNTTWYLWGCEDGDDRLKAFVVSRMQDVSSDPPGSATRPPVSPRHSLHPMTWEIDPPVEVTLLAPVDHVADVHRWLGDPESEKSREDGDVALTYRVTNRAALRARIYLLGRRVRVLGPDDVRQELLDELAQMAGE